MGRIKTQLTKRVTLELYRKHTDKFTKNFAENKEMVKRLLKLSSKKQLNVISGYLTRLTKGSKKILIS
ncbi:MAG: 30S ribosomal protein S17e [Nanobdellota archaeon]